MPFNPYGRGLYGQGATLYGVPTVPVVSSTVTVQPPQNTQVGLYSSLQVSWTRPGGNWNEQILVRSSYGVPITPFSNDGVVLLDQTGPYSTQFVDTDLQSGRFYYYAVFVFDTDVDEWLFAGGGQGLCLTYWGDSLTYQSWTPDWYLEMDAALASDNVNDGPLVELFNLIGFETDWIRSEIESFFLFTNPELVSGALLPYLGGNYGIDYEPELGQARSRVLIEEAVHLYKFKGTLQGVQGAGSGYSGYACIATVGKNLEIQLDDSAFDQSVGHWVPTNNGTSISLVTAASQGIVPAHATFSQLSPPLLNVTGYQPIPSDVTLMADLGVLGYMPPNNENVALITAASQYGWQETTNPQTLPAGVNLSSMAYDTSSSQLVLFGGVDGNQNVYNTTWVWSVSLNTWIEQNPATSPPGRYGAAMAYDPAQNCIVLFGGEGAAGWLNDTWIWNGTNWVEQFPTTSPAARELAIFCPAVQAVGNTQTMLLYGGVGTSGGLQDTWFWDGTNWTNINPSNTPGVLYNAANAYIPAQTLSVIFGGSTTPSSASAKTWVWNPAALGSHGEFLQMTPAGTNPSARYGPKMIFDGTKLVMFGGTTPGFSGANLQDTWTLTGPTIAGAAGTWAQVASTGPSLRSGMSVAFGPSSHTFLFGGVGAAYLADTWEWNGAAWGLQDVNTSPIAGQTNMVYDSVNNQVIAFGGYAGVGLENSETWAFNSGWVQRFPANPPSPRGFAAVAFDAASSVVVMFGGLDDGVASPQVLNDTWTYNYATNTWTRKTPSVVPPARWAASCTYDAANGVVLMYGGLAFNGLTLNDTWTYNVSTGVWTEVASGGLPEGRYGAALAYTSGGKTILFGGLNANGADNFALFGDTWQWNGSSWAQLFPLNAPPARSFPVFAYDVANGFGIMMGGTTDLLAPNGDGGSLSDVIDDIWQWNGTNWEVLNIAGTPPARATGTMVYDSSNTNFYLIGGIDSNENELGDFWQGTYNTYGVALSTCTSKNATVLGIPILQTATPPSYVMSAYVMPQEQATPVLQSFYCQLDWYSQTGALLSSTAGAPVPEIGGQWVRPYVVATPPPGAYYMGRSFMSSTVLNNDVHFLDAEMLEIPSAQASTPIARNLVANSQGLAGTYGWTGQPAGGGTPGSLTPVNYQTGGYVPNFWPAGTNAGFQINPASSGGVFYSANTIMMAVTGGATYSSSAYMYAAFSDGNELWQLQVAWYATTNPASLISTSSGVSFSLNASAGLAWAQLPVLEDMVAPSNANFAIVSLVRINFSYPDFNTNDYYFTAVVLSPGNNTTYFDGTFLPSISYGFEGIRNESVSDYFGPAASAWAPPRDLQLNLFPVRQNLVPNPVGLGGTNGLFGWTDSGGTLIGSQFLATPPAVPWPADTDSGFVFTSTGTANLVMTSSIAANANVDYTFSAYSVGLTNARTVQLALVFKNSLGATLATHTSTFTETAYPAFERGSVAAVAPVGTVSAAVSVTIESPTNGEVHYIGAVMTEPTPSLGTYFDGNFPGASGDYLFEATPNESISDYYPLLTSKLSRLASIMPEFIPIGSTFSLFVGAEAFANAGLNG